MKLATLLLATMACSLMAVISASNAQLAQPKDAEPATAAANAAVLNALPFADREDFENAQRGLIAGRPSGTIKDAQGNVIWDLDAYTFQHTETVPATVNPSLWRQERLNNFAGLFKVVDRIFQIRGFDLSNMTIIEGSTGLIIIDPLISVETAKAGLELYYQHQGRKPVVAVIYSHSHLDHYGGVKGVVAEDEVQAGKVQIYAPQGFLEHAVSENVFAGNAMSRRALYMYGALLPKSARGQVGAGLGKTTSLGSATLIPPTDVIAEPLAKRTIDGIDVEFQLTPGTEAPAEMNMYFPPFRALGAAENATHTMHNILTLRGAEVRNPKAWSSYLTEAIALFGDRSDVVFAQHHWLTWGTDKVKSFLADQRDMYQYLNDQTLRLLNHGYTPMEIVETLKQLPPNLAKRWYNRDYYGSISHNVRAIYQRYLGFYDANPAHLNPLPPVDAGKRYVEFMGGADRVIAMARESFKQGEYRWVAQVMNHVVFAEPDNQAARELAADALEQLGYQAENGTWRNVYLMGAFELRNGVPKDVPFGTSASPDMIKAMPVALFFDYMGIRLNGEKAAGVQETVLNWNFTDVQETYALTLRNGALTYRHNVQDPKAATTITLTKATLDAITLGQTTFDKAIVDGTIKLDGDTGKVGELFGLLDTFEQMFNIVTP